MYDKIIFFNEYGAGDIFESREFVKDIMRIIPAREYFYGHGKHPEILKDIPEIKYIRFNEEMISSKAIYTLNNTLYINTWIGRDSRYVLPNIGCTLEQNYRMFNDILSNITEKRLSGGFFDYVPVVDYSYYDVSNIDSFINQYSLSDKVLICNGPVQSAQASNFDFTPVVLELSTKFPHTLFILTNPINETRENIFLTTPLIGKYTFDLNEISYLSKFCKVIIGRKSGPFVFCGTKENWDDIEKKFVSFTYGSLGSSFMVNLYTRAQKYWSGNTETDKVVQDIEGLL